MNDLINTLMMRNTGFILILLSLLFSWVLVIYRYIIRVDEKRVNTEYILKGHIDFLLMGLLLLMLSYLSGIVSPILIILSCIGTAVNPSMFIVLAFNPNIKKSPKSPFGMATTISYVCTTVGIGGICMINLFHS